MSENTYHDEDDIDVVSSVESSRQSSPKLLISKEPNNNISNSMTMSGDNKVNSGNRSTNFSISSILSRRSNSATLSTNVGPPNSNHVDSRFQSSIPQSNESAILSRLVDFFDKPFSAVFYNK